MAAESAAHAMLEDDEAGRMEGDAHTDNEMVAATTKDVILVESEFMSNDDGDGDDKFSVADDGRCR